MSYKKSYAKELIQKYIEQGLLTVPEGMRLEKEESFEEEEKFGVKEFIAGVFIMIGFIVLTLLYFGNPETIAFVRQILK